MWALEHRLYKAPGLSCSLTSGIFSDQGVEPVSPALAGKLFTTREAHPDSLSRSANHAAGTSLH